MSEENKNTMKLLFTRDEVDCNKFVEWCKEQGYDKEEPKYYTPEIEEFHIGFHYKYYNEYSNSWKEIEFEEEAFQIYELGPYDEETTVLGDYSERIRVKYLDKEDIESLGFKKIPHGHKSKDAYEYGDHVKVWERGFPEDSLSDYTKIITCYDGCLGEGYIMIYSNVGADGGYREAVHMFSGIIKNKSELIVLLKQLGFDK